MDGGTFMVQGMQTGNTDGPPPVLEVQGPGKTVHKFGIAAVL
jgi:hypothetical protein